MQYDREYSSLRCLISVPPGQPPAGGWPVLVFLHGDQEAAPRDLLEALTAHGPMRKESGEEATGRFVVVAPQLRERGRSDVWASQAETVEAIAGAVTRDFGGDSRRVYLTGFSYGGNGVLSIGARRSDVWAALWPVDPTQPPAASIERPMWISGGQRSRANKEAFTPPPGGPTLPERVHEDAGLDHLGTAVRAYQNRAIYDWLLTHCAPRGPRDGVRSPAPNITFDRI